VNFTIPRNVWGAKWKISYFKQSFGEENAKFTVSKKIGKENVKFSIPK
jgi:hypothetical protein